VGDHAKRYVVKRPVLRVEGGILRPRVESLGIGGRDGTKLVQAGQFQVERVNTALGDAASPITAVLRFLEADSPLIRGSSTVVGVNVLWSRLLVARMTEATPQEIDVNSIHTRLATAFSGA
jgi:hypothetical protein